MARIRSIKPEFFRSDQVAEVSPLARLMFIGLWTMADRRGRLEDRPKRIKIECLPYDKCDPDVLLGELAAAGLIERYSANGTDVVQITTFEKHQRITGSEAMGESTLPEKPAGTTVETTETQAGNTQETPRTTGRKEGKGKEGKEGTSAREALAEVLPDIGIPITEPEVVDDVGLVLQHVRSELSPRFSRDAQERHIKPRLKSGSTVAEMCLVVDHKKSEWAGTDQSKYLRPETLFRVSHWESYLIAAVAWDEAGRPPMRRNGKVETLAEADRRLASAGH